LFIFVYQWLHEQKLDMKSLCHRIDIQRIRMRKELLLLLRKNRCKK
jgi:hypothetical protein